jgi:quinol monooxygenase YgiN
LIIVLGHVVARADTFDEMRRISLEHVHRSRMEYGCIAHGVCTDSDNPLKLVFVEKWKDAAALAAHFKVKGSIDFVTQARVLASAPPVIEFFEAAPAKLG